MNIQIHTPTVPGSILQRLEQVRLHYTTAKTLFHFVWIEGDHFCGVFGDGENGAYEWFEWNRGKLETSDCGYGGTDCALRDVLVKAVPAGAGVAG